MRHRKRSRMSVQEFAFARGATGRIEDKQTAERVWEPRFDAEPCQHSRSRPRVEHANVIVIEGSVGRHNR
jgi:hypothetical protein